MNNNFNLINILKTAFKNQKLNMDNIKQLYFYGENIQILKNDFYIFFLLEYLNDYDKKQLENTKYITLTTTNNNNKYINKIFNFHTINILNLSEYFILDEITKADENYFKEKEKIFVNLIKELYIYYLKLKDHEHVIKMLDYFNLNIKLNNKKLTNITKKIKVKKSFGESEYKYISILDILENHEYNFELKEKYNKDINNKTNFIDIEKIDEKLNKSFVDFLNIMKNIIKADGMKIEDYIKTIQEKNINIYITNDINNVDKYNLIDFQNLINFTTLKNYFKIFLKNLNLVTDIDTLKYYFNIFGTNDILENKYYIKEIESNYIHNEIFKIMENLKYIKNLYVRIPLFFLSDLDNYMFYIENLKNINKKEIYIKFSDLNIKEPGLLNFIKNKYLITNYETIHKLINKNKLLYKNFEYNTLQKDLLNIENLKQNFNYINIEEIILYRKFLNVKNCFLFIENIETYKKIDDIRKEFANYIEEKFQNVNNIEDFLQLTNKINKCYQMSIDDTKVIENILLSRAFETFDKF